MLFQKIKRLNVVPIRKIKAVTFIELLASTALFITILFSISYFYSNSYKHKSTLENQSLLQKQSTQIMQYLKQHIEHINFQGMDRYKTNMSLFRVNNNTMAMKSDCLVFFYDVNDDGCIGDRRKKSACFRFNKNNTSKVATELFGFKVEHQEIKTIYYDRKMDKCTKNQCQNFLKSCEQGSITKWRDLTEYNDYKVSQLGFSWVKENRIMRVVLTLSKDRQSYTTQAYIYILNS